MRWSALFFSWRGAKWCFLGRYPYAAFCSWAPFSTTTLPPHPLRTSNIDIQTLDLSLLSTLHSSPSSLVFRKTCRSVSVSTDSSMRSCEPGRGRSVWPQSFSRPLPLPCPFILPQIHSFPQGVRASSFSTPRPSKKEAWG